MNDMASGENAVSSDNFKLIFPKCHSPFDCEKYNDALAKSESNLNGMVVSNKFLVGDIPFNEPTNTSPPSEPLRYIPILLSVEDE